MKQLILSTLVALCAIAPLITQAQSQAIEDFYASEQPKYKFYAYQSMLRLLNTDKDNQDFNYLIKDLDHIKLAINKKTGEDEHAQFTQLVDALEQEGSEELLSFNNAEYKCRFYELASGNQKSTWVAVVRYDGRTGLLEMVGSLDMKYLHALDNLNFDALEDLAASQNNGANWD